ncbi:MAG: hypothetical protein MJ252_00560, partial [archaeon]|nr:hypothetical protein [archaeon]
FISIKSIDDNLNDMGQFLKCRQFEIKELNNFYQSMPIKNLLMKDNFYIDSIGELIFKKVNIFNKYINNLNLEDTYFNTGDIISKTKREEELFYFYIDKKDNFYFEKNDKGEFKLMNIYPSNIFESLFFQIESEYLCNIYISQIEINEIENKKSEDKINNSSFIFILHFPDRQESNSNLENPEDEFKIKINKIKERLFSQKYINNSKFNNNVYLLYHHQSLFTPKYIIKRQKLKNQIAQVFGNK